MKKRKKLLILIVSGSILTLLLIILMDCITNRATAPQLYEDVAKVPKCESALLLGTSQFLNSGSVNNFFIYRIDAAVELFNSGKVSHIVISGDNSSNDYNEPQDMKNALVARGVPSDKITLDYAGLNTYDSVYRMRDIFGQNKFIVISQKFHNQRAIYISQALGGMTVYGYNAKDVDAYNGFRTKMREKLARVKMLIDITTNREPRFLGEKEMLD